MKTINAEWEMRNLGVECQELNIDKAEKFADVEAAVDQLDAEYQIVRVPSGRTEILLLAQRKGFQFIEMNIQFERRFVARPLLPSMFKRYENSIGFHVASQPEIEDVLEEVASGNMFLTDKVSLDPFFGPALAGKRYALWAADLMKQGAALRMATYKEVSVGFCLNIPREGYHDAFLGGVFPRYEAKGFGFLPLYANLASIYDQGGRIMRTGVSSNNLPIVKLHQVFDCLITGLTYVLFKHI